VSVADRGPGIAAMDREHIFDRFWRGGSPRLRGHGGTGLGLAIVASLVEAHGGTIEVASEAGEGTTFTIRLPLASDP
jgi:signal transduction histidine kinase